MPLFLFLPTSWCRPGLSYSSCFCFIRDLKPWAGILSQCSRHNKILNMVSQYHSAGRPRNSQERPKYLHQYHKPRIQIPFLSSLPQPKRSSTGKNHRSHRELPWLIEQNMKHPRPATDRVQGKPSAKQKLKEADPGSRERTFEEFNLLRTARVGRGRRQRG